MNREFLGLIRGDRGEHTSEVLLINATSHELTEALRRISGMEAAMQCQDGGIGSYCALGLGGNGSLVFMDTRGDHETLILELVALTRAGNFL